MCIEYELVLYFITQLLIELISKHVIKHCAIIYVINIQLFNIY